jgi:preprotein translocase subunit SecE
MAKGQRETLLKCFLSAGLYQWKQGKVLRRSTGAAILVAFLLASQALYHSVLYGNPAANWVAGAVAIVGAWVAFRVVNYPVFADFLIDVESEMAKVIWPSWGELQRATIVVLGVMFVFSALLLGYDLIWKVLLGMVGVLKLS